MVEEALDEAGLDVPLLVLRGDGGSMSSEQFRGSRRSRSGRPRLRESRPCCTSYG